MNALVAWLEKFFLPLASKIGGQKHLIALRDAFIGTTARNDGRFGGCYA